MKKGFKDIIWNAMGSTLNAVNSLIFLIVVTRINGVKEAGIFTIGYATACLLYTIAVYYGRAFQVTDNTNEYSDKDYLVNRYISIFITIIIALLAAIILNYKFHKLLILLLLTIFRATDALAESLYAVLQRNDKLAIVGKSMTIKAILCYICFFIVDLMTNNVAMAIVAIIVINLILIVIYDKRQLKNCETSFDTFDKHHVWRLFKDGAFIFIFTFLTIYLVNSPKYVIDLTLSEESQTIYGIIAMPATVMSLLSNFICHPFLVKIKEVLAQKNYKSLTKIVLLLLAVTTLLGLFIIIVAFFLGIPVLNLLYGLELEQYKWPFMLIMIGALSYGLWQLISQILIAMRITRSQTIIVVTSSILAAVLSYILIQKSALIGAGLSYMIVMTFVFLLYSSLLGWTLVKRSKS